MTVVPTVGVIRAVAARLGISQSDVFKLERRGNRRLVADLTGPVELDIGEPGCMAAAGCRSTEPGGSRTA